jgi:DNA polymerase I
MAEVICKLFQISFDHSSDKIIAKLYGRSLDGKKICLLDTAFDYIYAETTKGYDVVTSFLESFGTAIRYEKLDAEINDTPISLLKIYTPSVAITETLVSALKKEGISCYEHDVGFERKYLVEKQLSYAKTYRASYTPENHSFRADIVGRLDSFSETNEDIIPRVAYFDIETFDDGGGINYDKNPILMISIITDIKKVLVAKSYPTTRKDVEVFTSESDMLERFKDIIQSFNPDILCGYNIKGFDIPYLLRRYEIYGVNFDIGLNFSSVVVERNKKKFSLEGILFFDVFQLLRYIMRAAIPDGSLSLDNVSKKLLQTSKREVHLAELSSIWNHEQTDSSLDVFVDYCLYDSELCIDLFNYFKYDILEFSKMLNVTYEELSQLSFSQIVEYYLINSSREFNQIVPNKPDPDEVRSRSLLRFQGAFVYDPQPGFYENLAVFDFRSLYPTIIESHNITKGRLFGTEVSDSIKVPGKPYFFKQKPKAFIPSIAESLISRRGRLKELIKTVSEIEKPILASRIGTLKVIANSLYGYLGFYMARWYSYECAESVTAFGRDYIKQVISIFEKKDFKVIYSDTDSIFILLGNQDISVAESLAEEVNSELPGLMQLELENVFSCGIFVGIRNVQKGAKKKYALLDNSGTLKVAGMAMVRGDWSKIARMTQKEVIEILLKERNVSKAKQYVIETLAALHKKPLDEFIISTKLTKPVDEYESKGPHVVVAQRMMQRGAAVRPGSYIKYVIIKGEKGKIGNRARLPDEVSVSAIDHDYYIENQILPVLEGLFDVFGYDITELKNNKNQQSLDSFF